MIFCKIKETKCVLFLNFKKSIVLFAQQKVKYCININLINSNSTQFSSIPYTLILLSTYMLNMNIYRTFALLNLELSTFNISALSLYLWLGFELDNLRLNYYLHMYQSAYTLKSSLYMSKNFHRRCFVIFIEAL